MIFLGEIVCPKCSGKLIKKGLNQLCIECGAKWIIETNQDGSFKRIVNLDSK